MKASEARRVARSWTSDNCEPDNRCVGAFLAGSLAALPDSHSLPVGSDIDLIVVVKDHTLSQYSHPGKIWIGSVPLEVAYCPLSGFTDAEGTLCEPNFACHFAVDTIVWDPTGQLRSTHTYVASRYVGTHYIISRLERLRDRILSDSVGFMCNAAMLSHRLIGHGMTVSGLAQLALVANLKNPTYKHSLIKAQAHLSADLYDSLLGFLGSRDLTLRQVQEMYAKMMETFEVAVGVKATSFFGDADMFAEMLATASAVFERWFAAGHHRESVLWLLDLHASAHEAVANDGTDTQQDNATQLLTENATALGLPIDTSFEALREPATILVGEMFASAKEAAGRVGAAASSGSAS